MEEKKYQPKEGWQLITPHRAHIILENCPMWSQREVRKKHVAELAEQIKNGDFIGGIIEMGYFDGEYFLLDGQHRLMAVELSGRNVQMSIAIFLAMSREQLVKRYSVIDTGVAVRNAVDIMQAHGLVSGLGATKPVAGLMYNASLFAHANLMERRNINKDERNNANRRAAIAKQWGPYGMSFMNVMKEKKPRQAIATMLRSPMVCALGMITFKYQPEAAKNFWGNVISPDGLDKNRPEVLLREWFLTKYGQKPAASAHEKMIYALTAWNLAFLNKKKTTLLPTDHEGSKIEGTDVVVGVKIE